MAFSSLMPIRGYFTRIRLNSLRVIMNSITSLQALTVAERGYSSITGVCPSSIYRLNYPGFKRDYQDQESLIVRRGNGRPGFNCRYLPIEGSLLQYLAGKEILGCTPRPESSPPPECVFIPSPPQTLTSLAGSFLARQLQVLHHSQGRIKRVLDRFGAGGDMNRRSRLEILTFEVGEVGPLGLD